jgi:hypothetical protein
MKRFMASQFRLAFRGNHGRNALRTDGVIAAIYVSPVSELGSVWAHRATKPTDGSNVGLINMAQKLLFFPSAR